MSDERPEPPPFDDLATGPEGIDLPPPPPMTGQPPTGPITQAAALSTSLNPRLAPQDVEAERSVLGGVLLTNDALFDVLEMVRPEDFYREAHRKIFTAMQELSMRNEPIDIITLGDELRKKGELEAVGGPAYISSLDASVPATANLGRYAKIVSDKARARRMIEAAHAIAREGYEQQGDTADYLDSSQAAIMAAANVETKSDLKPAPPAVKRVFAAMEAAYEKQSEVTGISSGFEFLDRMTAGWQREDLIVVAGRPSMGKTSIVMNMAAHVAIEKALPVAVFSLEMSEDLLYQRLFSSEARVLLARIRNGLLDDTDWPKLARAADRIHRSTLFVDDSAALSVMEIRAKARRLKVKHGDLGLVVIDYLQLMRGAGNEGSREQEISTISRGLKALAKELHVPVIALSQLNRSLERREDKRPQLSDLRESGAIEQDADVIAFIYRDEVYNKETTQKGKAEIILGKARNGATGTVCVGFQREYTRFYGLDERESYPQGEQ